ncbi:MAG: hypothetical protein ACRDNF_03835 [Streptosporangiaceae bacterium]
MTRTAFHGAPVTRASTMPVIDPQSLTPAQRTGRRCAVPNCRRLLSDTVYQVGRLPGGKPVVVCEDCAPMARFEPVARAA